MEPIAVTRGDGEWVLVHRCLGCGEIHLNRSAGDDVRGFCFDWSSSHSLALHFHSSTSIDMACPWNKGAL